MEYRFKSPYLNIHKSKLFFKDKDQLALKNKLWMIFFLIGFIGYSQVSIKVDTTKIRIGEQINYQIIVKQTNNVQFPKLQLDSLKKVEVVKTYKIDSLKNLLVKKYALTSFDSGRWVLPQQKVFIKNRAFLTDSLIIDVATVAVDTIKQPLFPIKTIHNEPFSIADYKNYIWIFLAILIAIILILYFIFRKKPTKEELMAKIPPFEQAKQRLLELDGKKLIKQNRIKPYYVELTDIVRSFIEREMNIPALESTTDELIETITDFNNSSNLDIPREILNKLKLLLREADLVKFAKSKPLLNEIEMHRNDAETIIEKLHPEKVDIKTEQEDGQ